MSKFTKLIGILFVLAALIAPCFGSEVVPLRKVSFLTDIKQDTVLPCGAKFNSTGMTALVTASDGRYIPIMCGSTCIGFSKETSKDGNNQLKIDEAYITDGGLDILDAWGTDIKLTAIVMSTYTGSQKNTTIVQVNGIIGRHLWTFDGLGYDGANPTDEGTVSRMIGVNNSTNIVTTDAQLEAYSSAPFNSITSGNGVEYYQSSNYTLDNGSIVVWYLTKDTNDTLSSYTLLDSNNYKLTTRAVSY